MIFSPMRTMAFVVAIALGFLLSPALPEEFKPLRDEKTGEWTPRGLMIALVATGQVVEMRCGLTGQITAAIEKASRLGIVIDVNEKQDYSDIIYLATNIALKAKEEGIPQWCKNTIKAFENTLK